MLRITLQPLTDAADAPRLVLAGTVTGPWVEELAKACAAACAAGRAPVLDMAEVSYVDPDGARLIRRWIEDGAALRGCSPFVRHQLEGI